MRPFFFRIARSRPDRRSRGAPTRGAWPVPWPSGIADRTTGIDSIKTSIRNPIA
jgi:hypothetical protein